MKLSPLIAFLLFLPAPVVAQCVTGTAVPVCQLTVPVITSPLTVSCSVSATSNQCPYQATASGNPTSYYVVGHTDINTPGVFTTLLPGTIGSIVFSANNGAPGTYAFTVQAISTTGVSAPATITATVTS